MCFVIQSRCEIVASEKPTRAIRAIGFCGAYCGRIVGCVSVCGWMEAFVGRDSVEWAKSVSGGRSDWRPFAPGPASRYCNVCCPFSWPSVFLCACTLRTCDTMHTHAHKRHHIYIYIVVVCGAYTIRVQACWLLLYETDNDIDCMQLPFYGCRPVAFADYRGGCGRS